MVLVLQRCLRILSVRIALYIIPSLLWLVLLHVELKGHCIEFKYYADGIHSGLTPPG